MSTPTPQTDAAVRLTFAAGHNTVCPNFARKLERELTALTAERDQLRAEVEAANKHRDILKESNDRACAEVERLTNQRDNLLKPMREQAIARAERAEAELAELHAILNQSAADMTAGTITAGALAVLRDELATEREKVRVLGDEMRRLVNVVSDDDAECIGIALAAAEQPMKEETK
jgi:chromosome segregation ATPase